MSISMDQYNGLVEKLADELLTETMEKTAETERKGFNERFHEQYGGVYDSNADALKRFGKDTGIGAGIGALAGAAAGVTGGPKTMAQGAGVGALAGGSVGSLVGMGHQMVRDDRVSRERYKDDPKRLAAVRALDIGTGYRMGPKMVDNLTAMQEKKRAEKAAEDLIITLLEKQAALYDADEASLVVEASELAMNSLGYTMFEEE